MPRKWIAISTRTQIIEVPDDIPVEEQKIIALREAQELEEIEWNTYDITAVPENRIVIRSREAREARDKV